MNMLASNKYGIEPGNNRLAFLRAILRCCEETEVHGGGYPLEQIKLERGLSLAREMFKFAHAAGRKLVFIGNGGSAAIASHFAVDYTKNGGIRAMALNDAATLTCFANDYGYEQVFAKQIEAHGFPGDVAVIVSTSGTSRNILAAASAAKNARCEVVTFSGMRPDNALRRFGSLNFYVPAGDYGLVECAHTNLLHSMVSIP